ncbi:MAG: glycosyltransferase family 4 protein [Pseudomonadota bacterium]
MTVIVIHSSTNERGGVFNASLSHTHGLLSAGTPAELWTASPAAERAATALDIPVFRHDAVAEPWAALWSGAIWRRGKATQDVRAVLHQGGKSWLWAWALWPGAVHAVRFPNYRIGDRRLFRNWMAVSTRHAERLRQEKTLGFLTPKVATVKNGDVQSASKRVPPRRPFRADGPMVIGALGTLSDRKGQDLLIKALAELRRRGIDAELRLGGGPGNRREAFERLAASLGVEQQVKFLGWVDAIDFMSELDVFCLPSRSEPFGIVLLEAMAQALPVVASDVDGPADILAADAGLLVPADNADAFADALATLAGDPAAAVALGERARDRAAAEFSPYAVGDCLLEAFQAFGARIERPGDVEPPPNRA